MLGYRVIEQLGLLLVIAEQLPLRLPALYIRDSGRKLGSNVV
jgi:hypothetical protein